MSHASPMAGPQPEMPLPATPMPAPCFAVISSAVASAAVGVQVHAGDVRPVLREPVGDLPADAAAGPDHHRDPAGQLLLRRHPPQLRLFELPVLDVERFLLRQGDVLVDRLGPAHHLDGAVVELGRHARLALVLAPGDHADAGDEDHRRVRVAHRRRVGPLARLVVRGVVRRGTAPARRSSFSLSAVGRIGTLAGVPGDVERLDLRPQEVVGAARAEFGQPRRRRAS